MGLGAIVVLGAELEAFTSTPSQGGEQSLLLKEPLPCIEVLARSILERTIERFVRAGVEVVSVLVPEELSRAVQPFSAVFKNIELQAVADMRWAVTQKFAEYSRSGIDYAFVVSASTYTETDLLDLFYFHREAKKAATRAFSSEEPLDLWVVDCAKAQQVYINSLLGGARGASGSYLIRDYVKQLAHPRDLRGLVSDALRGTCAIRPAGMEVRPGIWIGEGAEVHRRARIVAPAYVGRGSKIREDVLITRFSSIERECYVDYGTAVEDSSVLANTHLGIWLDVRHSVAKESKLLSLEHNVILEISDPSIMRSTTATREEAGKISDLNHESRSTVEQRVQKKTPAPERWQFGANPIQGD